MKWKVQGTQFPAGAWGLESRTRCAGFRVTEIGNRKERLRVREAGASAAGRGQRPYASFSDQCPKRPPFPSHVPVPTVSAEGVPLFHTKKNTYREVIP